MFSLTNMEIANQTYINKATKIGNSLWILIPMNVRDTLQIQEDEEIIITINKKEGK